MWVGLIQSAESLNKTKEANPPTNKREFLLPDGLWMGHQFFSFWLQMLTETSALPGSPRMPAFKLDEITGYPDSQFFRLAPELNHQSSWVSRLPTCSAALGVCQPPNYVIQIPNNKYLSSPIYIYTQLLLFLWRTLRKLLKVFISLTTEIVSSASWVVFQHLLWRLIPILHACYKYINNVYIYK